MTTIDCISDLHGHYPKLEGGDLLIVAGDLTATDSVLDHMRFQMWLHEQNYKKRIIIAGNHDNRLQQLPFQSLKRQYAETGEDYLCDSGTEFEYIIQKPPEIYLPADITIELTVITGKLKIWGSPWTLRFEGMNPECMAFTVDTEEELAEKWAMIPEDTDILVTHNPSFGNFDVIKNYSRGIMQSCGSVSLWMKCLEIRPKLHVFGHIHEGYGQNLHANGINIVNASHVNEHYKPINKPIRVIL